MEFLEKMAEEIKQDMPKFLVEAEKDKMSEEMKRNITQMGVKWDDYLKHIKKNRRGFEERLGKRRNQKGEIWLNFGRNGGKGKNRNSAGGIGKRSGGDDGTPQKSGPKFGQRKSETLSDWHNAQRETVPDAGKRRIEEALKDSLSKFDDSKYLR